jgi:hypothetical protein
MDRKETKLDLIQILVLLSTAVGIASIGSLGIKDFELIRVDKYVAIIMVSTSIVYVNEKYGDGNFNIATILQFIFIIFFSIALVLYSSNRMEFYVLSTFSLVSISIIKILYMWLRFAI